MNAVRIAGSTMIGSNNCFSVEADDGNRYRIVNFYLETLEALQKAGLTFPVSIRVLKGKLAVIHDPRIKDKWYAPEYCEVCCPVSLLPEPQQFSIERQKMRGQRIDDADGESYTFFVGMDGSF